MGGSGSTRWNGHEKRTTVEECLVLSISDFTRQGIIEPGVKRRGILRWYSPLSGEVESSLTFEVNTLDMNSPLVWLFYELASQGKMVNNRIGLETTPCHFGGERWWMQCPAPGATNGCEGRRFGKLYLPPGAESFSCRECHDLSYRSCQPQAVSVFRKPVTARASVT